MDTTKVKPVVRYKNPEFVKVGYSAYVVTLDHPNPNITPGGMVRTSKVLSIEDNGNFETMNTRYEWVGIND